MGRRQMDRGPGERIIELPGQKPLTKDQRLCIEVLNSQERITSFPYYSTIKVMAMKAGDAGGPYTYTIQRGTEVRAFSYGVRMSGVSAGFPATDGLMTFAETNLQNKSETNNGQSVVIYGMACIVEQGGVYKDIAGEVDTEAEGKRFSDARLLAQVATNCSISINLNGDEQWYRLGKLSNVQGHGGLQGAGNDSLAVQAIDGGRLPYGFMTNAWPVEQNYFKMPEGLVWKPKGHTDAQLEVLVKFERDVELYSGGTQFELVNVDEAAAAGVRGYTYPDVVLLVLTFYMRGWVLARRTNVS